MTAPVFSVTNLSVTHGGVSILHDISFDLAAGECLAIVGLSGCGKTTLMRALLGLLPQSMQVSGDLRTAAGTVPLGNTRVLRRRLGREIGFVAQNPFDACAPLRTVRAHIAEAWRAHGLTPDHKRIIALCNRLGLAKHMLERYPHEWSGGMLQRANIAAAIALSPPVLLADEPTSAVDADMAERVMSCLRSGAPGVIVVSHDLPLVARCADRVILIEDGRIAAIAGRAELSSGRAPAPLYDFIRTGQPPCPAPPAPGLNMLDVRDLAIDRGGRRLVSGLNFALQPGKILGVAGPSGVGKTSLLATLAGRLPPAAGVIVRGGQTRAPRQGEVLVLFQDAVSSMNPRWPVSRIVSEPLTSANGRQPRRDRPDAIRQAMGAFGLGHINLNSRPGALSMGQAQRVTLARASLAKPTLILADEPTSALDPRQKSAALAGLARLAKAGAAIILVSHDRAMLRDFCHETLELRADAQGCVNPAARETTPASTGLHILPETPA
ncbi:MAG: ABC transporter ATP-binding protein [Rhodobacteraceae bacterium]|nr:ABC transporter ATP-binding protein [Paracoccaceae bacterium]